MAEYYSIKIGDIYLSVDGMSHAAGIGQRCALEVDGVQALQSPFIINRENDMRGNPIITKTRVGQAGREIVINVIGKLPVAVGDQISDLHNDAHENNSVIRLIGDDSDEPDFDLHVMPDKDHFTRDRKTDGFGSYTGVVLRYVAVGSARLTWSPDKLVWGADTLIWNWS
jgi:hypothetical protein